MNGGKRPLGYTIIEVMIVLAISGVMFAIAASFISGKQENTAFHEGVNEFASQIQLLISQVEDGQYSGISFGCSYNGTIHIFSVAIGPNSAQGTNPQCDFLGKFLHFSENGDPTQYEVFSLAGARSDPSLGSATPIVGGGIDLTVQTQIPQSLRVTDVQVVDPNPPNTTYSTWGFGFVQGNEACANDVCPTNSQTIEMVYTHKLDGAGGQSLSETNAIPLITGTLQQAQTAEICVTDGDRYAQLTLGVGNGASPFNVGVNFFTKPYATVPPC